MSKGLVCVALNVLFAFRLVSKAEQSHRSALGCPAAQAHLILPPMCQYLLHCVYLEDIWNNAYRCLVNIRHIHIPHGSEEGLLG
ncbi:hypothetical protein GQ44DRAFT_404459 [Phaeosphaeriaceae sp. PMI808]|nr:hypothetical protein GQ44DRAFT_404459 [Phaeosphaeriaceae sp. PMI808]